MKSLETFEETFSDAVLGYLSTLIFSSFFLVFSFVIFGEKSYFCDIELWLLMDAYFRVSAIFATRPRKLLIQRCC